MAPTFDVPACSVCRAPAVVSQAYSGQNLCARHLDRSVRKKVGRELRKQLTIDGPTTVLVAISGGKDSAVLLSMLVDLIGNRPDVRIVAGCVDEGIEGYRPPSIEAAAQLCEMLDVEFITTSFAEQDFLAMDEVTASLDAILDKHPEAPRLPCSYCGVFRRQGINALAEMVEADVVALGHNLDDMAQTVLMNLTAGEVERSRRLAPHTERPAEGLAPRIVPLRLIPEQEVHLVSMHRGLPIHNEVCPNAEGALRWRMRDVVATLEEDRPGTRHGLVRTLDAIRAMTPAEGDAAEPVGACERCGSASSRAVCKACEMRDLVNVK